MNEPIFHHYVPRFYLSRFVNSDGRLFVYDKLTEKVFATKPENIAGQNKFYRLDELTAHGLDPLTLEKQFANLEGEVSRITNCWFNQIDHSSIVEIPEVNRELVSLYITTQLIRTEEARKQLIQFTELVKTDKNYSPHQDANSLQAHLLWDDDLINKMKNRISDLIWVFGKNESEELFCTSDHPVLLKKSDNTQWILGPRIFDEDMYIVFPLSPKIVLYCHDKNHIKGLEKFENSISPVNFTSDMVKHENSGQIGMSNRFVFFTNNNIDFAKEFLDGSPEFKDPNRKRF